MSNHTTNNAGTHGIPSFRSIRKSFFVPFTPFPYQAPRFAVQRGKAGKRASPKVWDKKAGAKKLLKAAVQAATAGSGHEMPAADSPVTVILAFYIARKPSHFLAGEQTASVNAPEEHVGTPDLDNLTKVVLDACNGEPPPPPHPRPPSLS